MKIVFFSLGICETKFQVNSDSAYSYLYSHPCIFWGKTKNIWMGHMNEELTSLRREDRYGRIKQNTHILALKGI